MGVESKLEIRPRTAGEVLDDAWRLALADAPQLLLLAGLFAVPAAVALLFLLTRPAPESFFGQVWLPALTALLLPLTGLGSAACQAAFRSRTEGQPVRVGACLKSALRNGLRHVTARALVLLATLLGALLVLLPALIVLIFAAPLHPMLSAGERRLLATLLNGRELQKAAVVILGRLFFLGFAVINCFLLIEGCLWIAGNLGGLDTALADVILTPKNLVYDLAVLLLAWLVLIPFTEAAHYLLYVDARVRHEGFDLRFQIERLLPLFGKQQAGAMLLALAAFLALAGSARAEGPTRGAGQHRPTLSREEIKKLLPEEPDDADRSPSARSKKAERTEERQVKKDEPEGEGGRRVQVRGPGVLSPGGTGGLGPLGWLLLGGLVLAVLLTAGLFFLRERRSRPPAIPKQTGEALPSLEDLINPTRPQTAAELWRKAEQLASTGNHLEAVRTLYLAVLALLHRANLIQYERTRTNGEYVRQMQLAPAAPEPIHETFDRLTLLFELKWYGERACDPNDFATCRRLAEAIRDEVTE